MPELEPITREEKLLDGEDLTPITRKEQFIKRIYDKTQEIPEPITREEYFLKKAGEGGGGDIDLQTLNVTENGTVNAPSGVAYDKVVTDVPQPTMTKLTATENRTYTAPSGTAYDEVDVDVPLPSNAYLLKELSNLPQPIASFSDGADEVLSSLKVGFDASTNKALMVVSNSNTKIEDNTPYVYRESPNAEKVALDIIGGTVAWNQLVIAINAAAEVYGITRTDASSGNVKALRYTGTSSQTTNYTGAILVTSSFAANHVFYVTCGTALPTGVKISLGSNDKQSEGIFKLTTTTFGLIINSGTTVDITIKPQTIDLTQMFGSTIANYIYSLEEATAGSGIAWLKSYGFLAKDYYAYDSGSLQSVNVSARKVYESNDTLLDTYPLDSSLTLRGIPKLDSNNKLYYDGDIYESDCGVTRKYGIVDLGTVNWSLINASSNIFGVTLSGLKNGVYGVMSNVVCPKYDAVPSGYNDPYTSGDKIIWVYIGSNAIRIKDTAYSDATTFKTAMNGVYLVYELATPTTESADAYENPQLVGSTEEFVDYAESQGTRDVAIPCGEKSIYFDGNGYLSYFDRTAQVGDTYDFITGKLRSNNVDYQEDSFAIRPMPSGTTYLFASTGDVEELKYFSKEA